MEPVAGRRYLSNLHRAIIAGSALSLCAPPSQLLGQSKRMPRSSSSRSMRRSLALAIASEPRKR